MTKIELSELSNIPECTTGAPLPVVVSDEEHVYLIYYSQDDDSSYYGEYPASINRRVNGICAIITFEFCRIYKFGSPNDETLHGHPLYKYGLKHYSAFSIKNSPWINEVQQINKVHSSHNSKMFEKDRHYIWTFQDSTFECISENYSHRVVHGSMSEVIKSTVNSF
mgnify:CR=1 FL=1|tara:strand:- start:1279 stop:1776 length:498 start_codon:yes stop_codon:yes gene_type:complete